MRLTLRTLLAFMDDILEPQDQEDLARQIEQSEKGTELIHRTRDAMRRLRLGAPPVIGQGMELDPNFTAEYLDSTLSSEQMTEYQQVCLDSDIHLAEVASCHHILTMVLGEPAEIEPEMRRRMYAIPQRQSEQIAHRIDSAHTPLATAPPPEQPPASTAPAPVGQASTAPAPAVYAEEPMTEVPDYLRASSRSRANRLLVAAMAILVLGALGYFSFGPNGWFRSDGPQVAAGGDATDVPTQPDAIPPATTGAEADQAAESAETTSTDEQGTELPPDVVEEEVTPSELAAVDQQDSTSEATGPLPPLDGSDLPDDVFETPAPSTQAGAGQTDTSQAETPPGAPTDPPLIVGTPPTGESPPATGPALDEESASATPPLDTPQAGSPGPADQVPANQLPPESPAGDQLPGDQGPMVASPDPGSSPDEGLPPIEPPLAPPTPSEGSAEGAPIVGPIPAVPDTANDSDTVDVDVASDDPQASPPAPGPLATLTSPKDILLRQDPQSGEWIRMKVNTSVRKGDRLMSLPTYRPSLALTSGLRVELADGTMLTLDREPENNWMVLDLTYGRVLMINTSMDPVAIEIRVGGTARIAEIAPARIVALDIVRPFVPGQTVEQQLRAVEGTVYVPQGGVVWTIDGAPTPIDSPAQWPWKVGPERQQPFDEQVTWLNGQQLDLLDRNASWRIEQEFELERPAGEQLLEAYDRSKRREEKVLLARSATHVGQFVPFVNALADSNQHSNWDSHINDLRAAMARSPELAERVHQTLIEQRATVPGMADDLYEMLRGYTREQVGSTPEEVKTGVLRKLIGWLNHDRLEYRVLAFHNLRQLTGGKSLYYNPAETNIDRRARSIRRWEQMLADNELVPAEVAPVLPPQ